MNLNDRVALILGRAVIHAEEMQIRAERAETDLAALQAEQMTAEEVDMAADGLTDRVAAYLPEKP